MSIFDRFANKEMSGNPLNPNRNAGREDSGPETFHQGRRRDLLAELAQESAAEQAKQASKTEPLPTSREALPEDWIDAERQRVRRNVEFDLTHDRFSWYLDRLVEAYQRENAELMRPGSPRHD